MQTLGGYDTRIISADRPAAALVLPPCPGCSQTCLRAFLDEAALELRQA